MKFACHIYGKLTVQLASELAIPKTCFLDEDTVAPICRATDELGVTATKDVLPRWPGLVGLRFSDNRVSTTCAPKYLIYYGDIRMLNNNVIPIVCDIMDENFWYHVEVLKPFGLFTFGIDADSSPLETVHAILMNLCKVASPTKYSELI